MARKQEAALHVGVHQRVVLFRAGIHEVLVVSRARVVDQNIQLPKGVYCQRDALFRRRLNRSVPCEINGLSPARHNLVAQLLQPLFAACSDDYICTLLRKLKRCRPANPRARSRNKHRLSRNADRIRHPVKLLNLKCGISLESPAQTHIGCYHSAYASS